MEIVRKVSVSEAAENTVCFVNSCDTGDEKVHCLCLRDDG